MPLSLPPVLLEQVLANIILNAVRAGATRLWVTEERVGQQQQITLLDNAGGLSAEQLSALFRPFHSTKKGVWGWDSLFASAFCAASMARLV